MRSEHHRTIEIDLVVLAIDSKYDQITTSAFTYRQANVYPYLEKKGFVVERCQGSLARRPYVALEARKPNVVYITGCGHGTYGAFNGDQGIPIFSVGSIENYHTEESQGKIIHFLSCQTAVKLGSNMVKNGCRAFFGYDENFTYVAEMADVFWECDSEIDRAFADGMKATEVHDQVRNTYEKRIKEYGDQFIESLLNSSDATKVRILQLMFSALKYDLNHLCSPEVDGRWGDTQARLE